MTQAAVAPSIISANLHIVGNLKTEGEVQVDGMIDGDVSGNALTVGEKATVKGEIIAQEVEVRGSVEGRILAKTVRLSKTAHVVGDIIHEILSIESGAYIEGQLQRSDRDARQQKRETFGKAEQDNAKNTDIPQPPTETATVGKKEPLKAVAN